MNWTFWLCYLTLSLGLDYVLDTYSVYTPLSTYRFVKDVGNDGNFFPAVLGPLAFEVALFYVWNEFYRRLK